MAVLKDLTVKVPAQVDDVMLLLVKLVSVLKQKGDYTSLVADLVKAVDGVSEIPEEVKDAPWELVNSVAFHSIEIAKALVK